MNFYHFTAERFIKSIKKEGLTKGRALASLNPVRFLNGYQWITTNSLFDQSWSEGTGALPYKRNEVRMTVKIPQHKKVNLFKWSAFQFMVPDVAKDLSRFGDPDNWYLYEGIIYPRWLSEFTKNE